MVSSKNGLVLFTASWASEPCSSVKEILSALQSRQKCPEYEIVDESGDDSSLFDELEIEMVPCLVRLVNGKETGRVEGSDPEKIISFVENDSIGGANRNMNLNTEIISSNVLIPVSDLVKKSKLMLFIKGTPSSPRCGFTSQLIKLFSEHGLRPGVHYDTFDILSDERVRQELKEWAQWPTYPQVYWCGDLLGGLDILKEMFTTDQMEPILFELKIKE